MNIVKNFHIFIFCLSLILVSACKDNSKTNNNSRASSKEKTQIVQILENPVVGNSALPRLFSNGSELFLSWVETRDTLAVLNYSAFNTGTWTPPETVVSGADWFVNWADFPAIAENNGNILTNILQKSADDTYTYDVKLNLFTAKDTSWNKDFILHDDKTKSEHGFVSMRPYVANTFMVTWLDGRETVGNSHGETHEDGHGNGQMTLRGALVFENGSIQYDTLLDDRVCDCCNTSTAIGTNDVILVAYRDRSEKEIRDVSVVRWEQETGWSQPKNIGNDNWEIPGCPVNGPSIDTYDDGAAIAWFTAKNDKPKVQIVFSDDNGLTFGLPIRVDSNDTSGRVDVAMISKESALVCWMENIEETTVIKAIKINSNGSTGEAIVVATTSPERASGFPQMEVMDNKAYFAWTDVDGKSKSVKTAFVDLSNL